MRTIKPKRIRRLGLAAVAAIALSTGLASCNGLYLGLGTSIGAPIPGGDVSLNVGTTIPLTPPIDPGLNGWGYGPRPWHGPGPWNGPMLGWNYPGPW